MSETDGKKYIVYTPYKRISTTRTFKLKVQSILHFIMNETTILRSIIKSKNIGF